ncbi:MAG: DUF2460 domain-containing protein [Chitinispirillales bacterium]|jgi:hypothetical protein|nr:DUF2460 domain-containing protein [Chitinispirillales bacterium]
MNQMAHSPLSFIAHYTSYAVNNSLKRMFLLIVLASFCVFSTTIDTLAITENDSTAKFETSYEILPKIFSLHQKQSVSTLAMMLADTSGAISAKPLNNDYSNLHVSGYKSFGMSVGTLGEMNFEQGLEVVIEGEIRPGTRLSAYLSDEGSSLDGSTREISEFDQVHITLKNQIFEVTAGDQFALWPIENGILSGQKKIMGISAAVTPERASVNAFGSFSGGNYTVQTVRGRNGVQGPYYLTGKGEAGFITPISGTVKIRVNGNNLEEGFDKDFTVDYDLGTVTFNPRVLIREEDFIRVEYEYKSFDYRRTFAGGGGYYYSPDSVLSIRGTVWSESDDKNNPIEMQLSSREREILRNSGNKTGYAAPTARPVNPLDVARMSAYYPLYRKFYDSAAQDTILVYSPYNPLKPEDTKGRYTAWFTPIQKGEPGADYVVDSTVQRNDFVYKYAGAGKGDFTALAPLSAPMRESAGELEARLQLPYFKTSINIAGKELDRNLFSSLDKEGNLSSAALLKMFIGERRIEQRSLWLDLDYRYRSRQFTSELFSAHERREGWDMRELNENSDKYRFQAWESTIGGTAVKGVGMRAGIGQTWIDSLVEAEKLTGDAEVHFAEDKLELNLGAAVFRHHISDTRLSYRRYGKLLAQPSKQWKTMIGYSDEWRIDTTEQGGGHLSGLAEVSYLPANLRQNFTITQFRGGESFSGSSDTGYAFIWNQSAAFAPLNGWNLTGDSRWHRTQLHGKSRSSTFLMSVTSEIEPTSRGFSSRQEYRTNQELVSRFEQKMFYIGKGLGTHAYDSLAREFRPSINGDHIVQEIEIYDNTSLATVRKTSLNGDWYFRPVKKIDGVLGNLSWSGTLLSEEHVNSRNSKAASRIPGLLTLFYSNNADSAGASDIHYADLSYRQEVEHYSQGSIYKSRLYAMPGLRLLRNYREKTFEAALRIERKQNRLLLSLEPRYLFVTRDDLSAAQTELYSNFNLHDINAEFVQSIGQAEKFEFYVREKIGNFLRYDPHLTSAPADSSIYLQINPGIIYRPQKGGMAELSYTLSYVPYKGELDYRMAAGYSSGISHILSFHSDIRVGNNFSLSGMYRGEIRRAASENAYAPALHLFSLQVKAFL